MATTLAFNSAQDYQDYADGYEQDNLYADYAMKQQEKAVGGGGAAGGMGAGKMAIAGGISWLIGGKFQSKRASEILKKKHMKEQKTLYSQYYNDVYKLQEQNAELADAIEKLSKELVNIEEDREMEKIQRDYDEFKQPDVDGDDRISRAEFNSYVKTYLTNYPGLSEKDYPRFEDFDYDRDGYVNFQEYSKQMKLQAQQAEAEAKRAKAAGANTVAQKAGAKAQALKGLAGETKRTDNFDDLYAKYAR